MSAAVRAGSRPEAAWDLESAGLALGLAALAHHAAHVAYPRGPEALDALARAIAFVVLPGWAAARLLLHERPRGAFEMGAAMMGLGAAVAALAGLVANALGADVDIVGTLLAIASLAALAPRRAGEGRTSAPSGASIAWGLTFAVLGAMGVTLATASPSSRALQPLADLLSPSEPATAGARAAGALCAALLALSGAALVRRWTRSAIAALAVALLIAGGAASIVFASRVRAPAPATAESGSDTAPAGAEVRP